MEVPLSHNDADNPPPQRPPEADPLPQTTEANQLPEPGDVDQHTWNTGVIVAAIFAAFAMGVIAWFATNPPRSANNPAPSSTGQSTDPSSKERSRGTDVDRKDERRVPR
jgi:hypothetical protein